MSKIDIAKQAETLSRLRDELSRLNRQFADAKKALGIAEDEEISVDRTRLSPELKEAMKCAEEKAVKAGRNAAAALQNECEEPAAAPASRLRRGALTI